jgi:hypothetical protein
MVATAPCTAQWAVTVAHASMAGGCGVDDAAEPPASLWVSMSGPVEGEVVEVDASSVVAGLTAAAGLADALVVVYTRAVDGAGNVQSAVRTQLYVDTTVPGIVSVVSGPEAITLARAASFSFEVLDSSPGLLRFNHSLMNSDGVEVWIPSPL